MSDAGYEADEEEEEESWCQSKDDKVQESIYSRNTRVSLPGLFLGDQGFQVDNPEDTFSQYSDWLESMEIMIQPVSINLVEKMSRNLMERKFAYIESQLVDIEEKRTSVKTLFSFSERKRNAVVDSQLQDFERRWNKLWLNFAEWKCLLEVAIDQHGKVRLNSNTDQYKTSVQTTKFTFPDSQSGSSDSSNSPVLVKRAASVSYSSSTAANNFLSLFPTNRRMEDKRSISHSSLVNKRRTENMTVESRVDKKTSKVSITESRNTAELQIKTSSSYSANMNQLVAKLVHEEQGNQITELDDEYACNLLNETQGASLEELILKEQSESFDASHVSDFWDQEVYLSEHNYDEALDMETAKTILNFGDDYRNFIESNSEVQSPRFEALEKKKKNSRSKLELERNRLREDSNSEEECADVFTVINDLKSDVDKYEEEYKIFRSKGFEAVEKPRQMETILEKCEGSYDFLSNLHKETISTSSIIGRKSGREIRFLQNRWKTLEKLVRKDQRLKSVYLTIKQDINELREDISEHKKTIKLNERKCVKDLRKYLRFYKDCNIKLTGLKSKLFEVNLAVHTLLADVSNNTDDEVKYLEVDRMKDDVVELYDLWDHCMKWVTSKLTTAEENAKNIAKIEKDLSELSDFLKKETMVLTDKIKTSEKTVDDSGISDESGDVLIHHVDILAKEENIRSLKICVREISKTLSPNAPVILGINSALCESAKQLKNLKMYLQTHNKVKYFPKKNDFLQHAYKETFLKRVWKFAKIFIIFLAFFFFILSMISPTCCEFRNNMFFFPRLTYVNGPPPI